MIFDCVAVLDVVEFETTIDKRKKKPVAINITLASPEIIGENRVEGAIAVVARLQAPPQQNGVITDRSIDSRFCFNCFPLLVPTIRIFARRESDLCQER